MASLDLDRTGGLDGLWPINAARKDTRLGARNVSAIGLPAANRRAGNPIHRNSGSRSTSGTLAGPAHVPPGAAPRGTRTQHRWSRSVLPIPVMGSTH